MVNLLELIYKEALTIAVLYTNHFVQFFDNDGNPLSGGKLYAYEAGTTTPKATYTTEDETTQHAHPIVLDSAGRATVFISGSYRFDLFDSNDVLIDSTDDVTAFFPDTDSGQPGQTFSGNVFFPDSGELTILSGSITPTGANHTIDTESDASTDDLDTIASPSDGQILTLRIESNSRQVVVKHNTGNIVTPNGEDITLSSSNETISFLYEATSSKWLVSSVPQSAQSTLTPWVEYTPVFTGYGTPTNVEFYSRRVGDTLEVKGKFTAGTTTATEARISLGFDGTEGGVSVDEDKLPSGTNLVGQFTYDVTNAPYGTVIAEGNVSYVTQGISDSGGSGLSKKNATLVASSGQTLSLYFEVPIEEWA